MKTPAVRRRIVSAFICLLCSIFIPDYFVELRASIIAQKFEELPKNLDEVKMGDSHIFLSQTADKFGWFYI